MLIVGIIFLFIRENLILKYLEVPRIQQILHDVLKQIAPQDLLSMQSSSLSSMVSISQNNFEGNINQRPLKKLNSTLVNFLVKLCQGTYILLFL